MFSPPLCVMHTLGLGDKDQALTWFERAYEEQDPALFYLKMSPLLDPLLFRAALPSLAAPREPLAVSRCTARLVRE